MKDIGVRELKIHASEIVRRVHEDRARYLVTCRGRPVGLLSPLEPTSAASPSDSGEGWARLESLAERIGKGWKSPESSVDILSGMRR